MTNRKEFSLRKNVISHSLLHFEYTLTSYILEINILRLTLAFEEVS